MSRGQSNDSGTGLEEGVASPLSPSPGAVFSRNSGLANKLTNVLSQSYVDPEIRDALAILDARGVVNNGNTRRGLRLDVQKEIIECNGAIVQDFGLVAVVRRSSPRTLSGG